MNLFFALIALTLTLTGCICLNCRREGTVQCMDGQTAKGVIVPGDQWYYVDTGDGQERWFPTAACTATWKLVKGP